jgi:hypothetical protein
MVGFPPKATKAAAMTGNVQAGAGDGSAERPGVSLRLLRKLTGEVPDHSSVWLRRGDDREVVTLGELRAVTAELPDDIPVEVAIRDRLHFNRLLGDLPITRVQVNRGSDSPVVLLDVAGVS